LTEDRRYQVFISSTFQDLGEERSKVMRALLRLGAFPSGMELFPAADDDSWSLIKRIIDQCDYYILIIAGRYGTLGSAGQSFTEMEYDYAVKQGVPVLSFIFQDPESLPVGLCESTDEGKERLRMFTEKVKQKACRMWTNADHLVAELYPSFIDAKDQRPRPGWIRSDQAAGPELLAEVASLREQNYQLKRANTAAKIDSTMLASGDDAVELNVNYLVRDAETRTIEPRRQLVSLTWNKIFARLGPLMFEEASETELERALAQLSAGSDREPGLYGKATLDGSALHLVKTQLVALGLITKSVRNHGVRDRETYWSLTAQGEAAVISLTAVRKPSLPQAEIAAAAGTSDAQSIPS